MSLRYGVLSLLVFFAIFILALKNYETWTLPIEVLPEKGVTKKSVEKIENPPTGIGQKESTDIQSYILISEKNIFSAERKEFPVVPPPSAESVNKAIVRPKIVLYGVTLADDYQSASIVNPGRPRTKGEREMMSVKVGDPIGEFKVAKILPDRILMEAAEDSFEVLLYDATSPKQRTYAKTEAKPATITSTLSTPATVPAAVPPIGPGPIPGPRPEPTSASASAPASAPPTTPGVTPEQTPRPTPAMTPTQTAPQTLTPPYSRRRSVPSPGGEAIGP